MEKLTSLVELPNIERLVREKFEDKVPTEDEIRGILLETKNDSTLPIALVLTATFILTYAPGIIAVLRELYKTSKETGIFSPKCPKCNHPRIAILNDGKSICKYGHKWVAK